MRIPWPKTALEKAGANVGLDWLEFSRSEDAQQLSACAWVSARSVAERPDSPLCIGHAPPSEQHAIRASGVGNQPAHTAPLAVAMTIARTAAHKRLRNLTTGSRMLDELDDVNCDCDGLPESDRPAFQ
jgi:hypothetical protein